MRSGRGIVAAAAAAGLAVSVASVAPVAAGAAWDEPQKVDGRYGWQVQLSDDGKMAAWIRVGKRPGPGPVRTAKYKEKKGRWSKSRAVPGAAEASQVTLSGDGKSLLIKSPTAYSVATRKGAKNKWAAPEPVATSTGSLSGIDLLQAGRISDDGRTVIWADGKDAAEEPLFSKPVVLDYRSRGADSTWQPVQRIAELYTGRGVVSAAVGALSGALSRDGSTVAFLDSSGRLVSVDRAADGTWDAPSVVLEYGNDQVGDPDVGFVRLSANGSRILWRSGSSAGFGGLAVLTSTKTTTGWADPTYVMQNDVFSVAMSPNGRVVAYGQLDPDRLRVRRYKSGKWTKPKTLGPSQSPQIVVRNKAVAWVDDGNPEKASTLRVSLLRKGKWGKATKVAPKAQSPALSRKGDTLAWAGKKAGGIVSVKR